MCVHRLSAAHYLIDNRSSIKKSSDFFKMLYKDAYFACDTFKKRFFLDSSYADKYFPLNRKGIKWEKNEGLILMIHGLFGHPSHWYEHIEMFKKYPISLEIKAPVVTKAGNCPIEEASEPILDMLNDYRAVNPKKPICILSNSNGGRIASYIDLKLRNQDIDLMISTIAGACLGSKNMDLMKKTPFISIFDKHLIEELTYQSLHSQSIINALREKIFVGTRTYQFYASTEDYIVPYASSLPCINQNEAHVLIHGEGHESITHKIRQEQVNSCINFVLQKNRINF